MNVFKYTCYLIPAILPQLLTQLANTKINSIMKNITKTHTKRQLAEHFVSIKITKDQLQCAIDTLKSKISLDKILNLVWQNDIDNLNILLEIQEEYKYK